MNINVYERIYNVYGDIYYRDYELYFEKIAVVDYYSSLIWKKKYNDIGGVNLRVPLNSENLKIFQKGNFITRDDDNTAFVITNLKYNSNVNKQNYLEVGAKDCKWILNQRCIGENFAFNGSIQEFVKKVITKRNEFLPIIYLQKNKAFGDVDIETNHEYLADIINSVCKQNKLGWYATIGKDDDFKLHDRKDPIVFDLYEGKQRDNVKFSTEYDNLLNVKYEMNLENYKNCAFVQGKGIFLYFPNGYFRTVKNEYAMGLNSYCKYVDGSDISTDDFPQTPVPDSYDKQLLSKGKEELSKFSSFEKFEAEVDWSGYKYKEDYDLGDVVTIQNPFGESILARISETTEIWDNKGYSIQNTFDYLDFQ